MHQREKPAAVITDNPAIGRDSETPAAVAGVSAGVSPAFSPALLNMFVEVLTSFC